MAHRFWLFGKAVSYFRGSGWTRLIISKLWVQWGSEEEFGFHNHFGDILEWSENLSLGCTFSRCSYLLRASIWRTKCFTHQPLKCTWNASGRLSIRWPYPMHSNTSSTQVYRDSGKVSLFTWWSRTSDHTCCPPAFSCIEFQMQAQSALTLERGICTWSSLYFTPWLELARLDLLARNGLCAMALLDSQTNVISFGFHVLMGVRLYFCSLWVCFLEKSHPAYWVTGLAALWVQTGEYSKKGKLVHTLRPVKWVSYIWPKGQCWREGSCGVYVPEGGAQFLTGWWQQGQRSVMTLTGMTLVWKAWVFHVFWLLFLCPLVNSL